MVSEFEFLVVETLHILSRRLAGGTEFDRVDNDLARPKDLARPSEENASTQFPSKVVGKIVPPIGVPEPEVPAGGNGLLIFPNDTPVKMDVFFTPASGRSLEPEVTMDDVITLKFE